MLKTKTEHFKGAHILQILGIGRFKWSKFHTEDLQIWSI